MTEPGQAGHAITALWIHEFGFHDGHQWQNKGVADAEYDQVLGGTHDPIPHDSLLDLFAQAFTNLRQNHYKMHARSLRLAASNSQAA